MADFIDASEAKKLLGCDDATLNNYVNNGTVRAQREGGALKLLREDVVNLAGTTGSDSDDGTIILSGDSEDLSIDLGEVVDDSAVTMVQTRSDDQSDSITFGDELEVVKFDESHTEELSFEDSDATQSLTFTDSNTAIGTDPEGTSVGTATATATSTSDFQTVDYGDEPSAATGAGTMRRSVRSQRVLYEKAKTHWIWPSVLVLNLLITALLVVPYFFLMAWPQEEAYYTAPLEVTKSVKGYDRYYINGEQRRGVIDGSMWTSVAEAFAGFSVEPDEATFKTRNAEGVWKSVNVEGQGICPDVWRFQQYRNGAKPEERVDFWTIDAITRADDGSVTEPAYRKPSTAESKDANGGTIKSFTVAPKSIEGLEEGSQVDLPVWSHK